MAWLGRRLTGDPFAGVLAMFVMATSIYFVKYAARAMTDVPFTFFFLAAVCAWLLGEDDPRWFLAAGAFAAMAQLTRALAGFSIPLLFAVDLIANRRRPPLRYLIGAAFIAFVPPAAWYAQWIYRYGEEFFVRHSMYMNQEVTGALSPPWRRYTGAFEYIWMISKSYWPWLPAMIAGMIFGDSQQRSQIAHTHPVGRRGLRALRDHQKPRSALHAACISSLRDSLRHRPLVAVAGALRAQRPARVDAAARDCGPGDRDPAAGEFPCRRYAAHRARIHRRHRSR